MRAAIGRAVAALTVIVSGYLILFAPDANAPSPDFPSAVGHERHIVPPRPSARDFYTTYDTFVPYGRTTLELPILLYHYIRVPPALRRDPLGYRLSVAPSVFSAQMDWLAAHGYHTVTFDGIRRYWARVAPLPAKPVIITLDDGYQDLYSTAYPILAAHGFTAVAYIVSGFIGMHGYVDAAEISEMDRHGIEIGAHTVNHADLARSPAPWLDYQVIESKRRLEALVGHPVLDMAYPSGKYDALAIAAISRAGYWSSVTEDYTLLHAQTDRFVWGRVRVGGGEPLATLITGLGPSMPTTTVSRQLQISIALELHHLD